MEDGIEIVPDDPKDKEAAEVMAGLLNWAVASRGLERLKTAEEREKALFNAGFSSYEPDL